MKRRSLTPRERAALLASQGGVCARCGEAGGPWIAEHTTCVAFGNDGKPDAIYCVECANRKTHGPRGDITVIASVKRIAEGRTQYDKRKRTGPTLRGRGFDKTRRKKFDGTVENKDGK